MSGFGSDSACMEARLPDESTLADPIFTPVSTSDKFRSAVGSTLRLDSGSFDA
mgnify:CR=1 FL=1|jgi:hypothetical protein